MDLPRRAALRCIACLGAERPARPPGHRPVGGRVPTKPPSGWLRRGRSRPRRQPQAPRSPSGGSRLYPGFRPADDPSPTPGARRHGRTAPRPHHRLPGVRTHPAVPPTPAPAVPFRQSTEGQGMPSCRMTTHRRGRARVSLPQRPSGGETLHRASPRTLPGRRLPYVSCADRRYRCAGSDPAGVGRFAVPSPAVARIL